MNMRLLILFLLFFIGNQAFAQDKLMLTQYYEGEPFSSPGLENVIIEITNVGIDSVDLSIYSLAVWADDVIFDTGNPEGPCNFIALPSYKLAPGASFLVYNTTTIGVSHIPYLEDPEFGLLSNLSLSDGLNWPDLTNSSTSNFCIPGEQKGITGDDDFAIVETASLCPNGSSCPGLSVMDALIWNENISQPYSNGTLIRKSNQTPNPLGSGAADWEFYRLYEIPGFASQPNEAALATPCESAYLGYYPIPGINLRGNDLSADYVNDGIASAGIFNSVNSLTIPATDGTLRTANKECDCRTWTYYIYDDPNDVSNEGDLLFSVKKDGEDFGYVDDASPLDVLVGGQASPLALDMNGPPRARYLPPAGTTPFAVTSRFWHITPATPFSTAIDMPVRFYYTPADATALDVLASSITALTDWVDFNTSARPYKVEGNYPTSERNPDSYHTTISTGDMNYTYLNNPVDRTIGQPYESGLSSYSFIEFKVRRFSSGGIYAGQNQVVLPVELTYFQAKYLEDDNSVLLEWQTESETNNDYFDIEYSIDGSTFAYLGQVSGAGTVDNPKGYNYHHENPAIGYNYYRLKQVDFNGNYNYSEIRLVEIQEPDHSTSIVAYPNPSSGLVYLDGNKLEEVAEILVINGSGQVVYQSDSVFSAIDLRSLSNGNYVIICLSKKGKRLFRAVVRKVN